MNVMNFWRYHSILLVGLDVDLGVVGGIGNYVVKVLLCLSGGVVRQEQVDHPMLCSAWLRVQ